MIPCIPRSQPKKWFQAIVLAALCAGCFIALPPVSSAPEATRRTDTVMILYTNDIHDSFKTRANGEGGMALISGFVRQMRAARKDVLLVDAGDVCEKGDMLGVVTKGEMAYRALAQVGYDAGAPGNHDFVYGLPQIIQNVKESGFPLLACNIRYTDTQETLWPAAIEKDVDGVRVGIIGAGFGAGGSVNGRAVTTLVGQELGRLLHERALEMEPRVQLTVAVLHYSSAICRQLAALAPEIDVFVSGHSHEVLREPIRLENGALIVQAGQYSRYIGQLELSIDLDTEEVVAAKGELVPLQASRVKADEGLLAQIRQWNREHCPAADEVVGHAPEILTVNGRARPLAAWLAEAVRFQANADIGLFSQEMIRRQLVPGVVTADDLYATMVNGRRRTVVISNVSGAQIRTWLERHLAGNSRVYVAGATIEADSKRPEGERILRTDIEPERRYRVAGPYLLMMPPNGLTKPDDKPTVMEYTAADAAVAYARHLRTSQPKPEHPRGEKLP